MQSTAQQESTILEIGKALSERAKVREPKIFHRRWWSDAILEWSTRDAQFKVQLFRFIDVLPMLSTDEQFVRMLHEYFNPVPSLPPAFRWFLRMVSTHGLASQLGARVLRRQFLAMARTFMAGRSVEDALPALARLWREGCAFSMDILGEAIVSEREADAYQQQYLDALALLGQAVSSWPSRPILERDHIGPIPRIQLSIKLSALYSQLDPIDPEGSYRHVAERLRPIVDRAMALPASITVDMEQAELKDLTVYIFTRLFSETPYRTYPHAGLAIQAYLKDSSATVSDLLAWVRNRGAPIGIRLVKGAYWDSEVIRYRQRGWPVPVFLRKAETDANYEHLTETLLANMDWVRPAFGSHNLRSLAHAQAIAQTAGVPREAFEFQMLYGMADSLRAAVVDFGFRMRVYTPIGELIPGMAYLVRRLLENTSNESFLRRQHEATVSIEELLRSPVSGDGDRPAHAEASSPKVERWASTQDDEEGFFNEPHTDFSHAEAREAMTQAIRSVQQQLGVSPEYRIAGNTSPSGRVLQSHDPSAPDRLVARFRSVSPEDLAPVFEAARRAIPSWRAVSPQKRAEFLFKTAALIRMRRMELAAWEIFETGKPWREADADIAEAIDFLEYYGRQMIRLGTPRRLGRFPGELNHRVFSPRGIAVALPPWNFPLAIPTGLVSAALVTGNVVLFKPSERAPMMGYHLYALLREAGVPEDVVHFLPGGPELGRALVAHPDVHVVAFTGSKAVGLTIMAQASHVRPGQRHVTHVIAEMGGKNAIIVDDTADLDEAVLGVLVSATGFQGQKCSACSRAIVLAPVYRTFIDRLTEAALSLHIGPPVDPGNRMGPLIDARALATVRQYIELGTREGRCVLDRRIEHPGYFQGPVILTDLPPDHRVAQEEIFGPVLTVFRVSTIDQALALANDSSYALTGGIYSRSPANIQRAREEFDVGNLYINRPITGALVGRQPFGGHRLSGIGKKAGGENYLEQFMVERVICENTLRRGFAPSE